MWRLSRTPFAPISSGLKHWIKMATARRDKIRSAFSTSLPKPRQTVCLETTDSTLFRRSAAFLNWASTARDPQTQAARLANQFIQDLLQTEHLFCIWSSRRLSPTTLDIDHCFPWSAWPCGDLWNLMPAHREVNSKKSNRLPSAETLKSAHDRILNWWESGYNPNKNAAAGDRFFSEAKSALPLAYSIDVPSVDDVFVGLEFQRLRLKHDQEIPEWSAR
jgi:hypothetical protein